MQPATLISIIIALASFILSLSVAYLAYFRTADIKFLIGRNLIFYPTRVQTTRGDIDGITFNVPITFYNWSPQGGTIYRVRLVMGRQQRSEYYDMIWSTFVKIGDSGNLEDEGLAQPIPVEARSSVNKIIRFDWNPEFTGEKIDIGVDKYDLMIFAWTKDLEKPDLNYTTSFLLKNEHYKAYNDAISSNNFGLQIWLPLEDIDRPNDVKTKARIESIYLGQR